jgi:hypothetical protein
MCDALSTRARARKRNTEPTRAHFFCRGRRLASQHEALNTTASRRPSRLATRADRIATIAAHHSSAATVYAVEPQPPNSCHSDPTCDKAAQGRSTEAKHSALPQRAARQTAPKSSRVSLPARQHHSGERTHLLLGAQPGVTAHIPVFRPAANKQYAEQK